MLLRIFLIICCVSSAFCTDLSHGDYYNPNEDPDRLVLWDGLFTKLNTLLIETDKITQNLLNLNKRLDELSKRQEDQGDHILKVEENVNCYTNQITNLKEAADLNTKYWNESRLESKERQEDQETKITQLMDTADLNTKYLNEIRLEANKSQEGQGNQILELVEHFNTNSKFLNESQLRQEDQANQITKLVATVDLNTKYLNDSRSESNKRFDAVAKRQDTQTDLMKKLIPWTTILRRQDGSVVFYRNWTSYQKGFGNPPNGEFFIGLKQLHEITTSAPHELMVVLIDWQNETSYAHYDLFEIGAEAEKYSLKALGIYSGDAGNALNEHRGMPFSTFDQDNDKYSGNCAKRWLGAWWFNTCYSSHLNGPYMKEDVSQPRGVNWLTWKASSYSIPFAEMKIRPKAP